MEYTVEPGQFELQVGTASDQIALRRTIGVDLSHEQHITSEPAATTSGTTIKEAPISVSGYVRDVQANPVENAVIESAGQTVRTDKHGFSASAHSLPKCSTSAASVWKQKPCPSTARRVSTLL